LSSADKDEIARQFLEDKVKAQIIARRYSITPYCVWKYARNVSKGLKNHERGGAPRFLEPEDEQIILSKISANRISMSKASLMEEYHEAVKRTAKTRGKSPAIAVERLSEETLRLFENRNGIKTKTAEVGVNARIESCADIRHMASFAAMNKWAQNKLSQKVSIYN
jgi:transposase-like protein